jgi:glycosyltransferase involved in cell wall biosynthesis
MNQPLILHVRPTFRLGGAEKRSLQIINYLGNRFRHAIVALDGDHAAAAQIDSGVSFELIPWSKTRNPLGEIRKLVELLKSLRPDLLLTYNWGSMDCVAANRLAPLCPLIHTEDGFGPEEANDQLGRRVWARHFLLHSAFRVITPSFVLLDLMQRVWKLRPSQILHVPNGVDVDFFCPGPAAGPRTEVYVGTVGNLTGVKAQGRLIEACAVVARKTPLRLLIAGEGPELDKLKQTAAALDFTSHVEFLGRRTDVLSIYRQLDIFALSSLSEQMSLSVLEAMACGLPLVTTDVGDTRKMVSSENAPLIVPAGQPYVDALASLAADTALRRRIGGANRTAVHRFSLEHMLQTYDSLYRDALDSRATA